MPVPAQAAVAPARLRAVWALFVAFVVLTVWESTRAWKVFWGAHHYAFFPSWVLVAALLTWVVAWLPLALRDRGGAPASADAGAARTRLFPAWVPWAVALVAGVLFWNFRLRHLYWGDALPLSINIPRGQAFHPDEPVTLLLHQALFRLGRGAWSGSTAVAIGSTLAGAAFAGWAAAWAGRVAPDRRLAALAFVVLVFQGYAPLFFGYVENYSYFALALLVFWTSGIDHLEGRGPLWIPLLAAAVALGFHILGGLLALPLAVLVLASVAGSTSENRRSRLVTLVLALAASALGAWILGERLGAGSPFTRVPDQVRAVLANPRTRGGSALVTPAHLRDVWSELVLLGPLSAPLLAAFLALLPAGRFVRTAIGLFCLAGAAVFLPPLFLTGEGSLGPARNWDVFAAPSIVFAITGVVLALRFLDRRSAQAILLPLAALSLFHTLPWIAINADADRARARLLALPLGHGRNALVLGTHHLNAGELDMAERWFRAAVAEDSLNANSQSGLGLVLARTGREAEALPPMAMAVRLRPDVAQYRKDLGALLAVRGACAAAATQWRAATVLDAKDADAWRGLVGALLCAGVESRALEEAETAARTFPGNPEIADALATAYDRSVARLGADGRYAEARAVLDAFARRFPADPRVEVLRRALDDVSPR